MKVQCKDCKREHVVQAVHKQRSGYTGEEWLEAFCPNCWAFTPCTILEEREEKKCEDST